MSISFTTPLALLLLLFVPYFIWTSQPNRHKTAVFRWRDWAILGLRLLIILLLILSLAGAQAVRAADTLAVVFLIDASDSISPDQFAQAEEYVRTAIESMGPNDQAAVILFGANALVERPMSGLAELAPIQSVPQKLHTDIAEAIRLGLALFPAGSAHRMVILSDGTATIGDTRTAARLAAAANVEIDYVLLERPSITTEVLLTQVNAPTLVRQGETFRIEITAESTTNTTATLRILTDNGIVYEDTVQLNTGANKFAVRLRASEQEFTRYRIQLVPTDDTYFQNNELSAFTEIIGPPRILIVANDSTVADDGTPQPPEAAQLKLALEAAGLTVDQTTPADLPAGLDDLSNYASIILVNVNAKNLSPRKMELLQSYVRDLGGGLIAIGGPQSYGMGGYFRTPLEETLPVEMQIKDQERFPSVSIVIVIDRSGSMGASEGGITKIQLAAEGAVRVVELLNDFDEITVIPVDTAPDNPIGPISARERETAIAQIRRIGAGGGGIYVRTGLEAAAQALENSTHQVKHIILLADGADSEQKEGVPELIRSLTEAGVTVSTVSIGNGPDTPWLQQMAELGNGRFHFTDRAANLPQIFTQETTSIQRSYLIEERFFPTLANTSPILANITAVPPLYGYVGTSPKDTARVVLTTHMGDPLLAVWQYGLGRAVAWTSDATGRWGVDWVRWEGFPTFWAQTVRWTISQRRDTTLESVVTYVDETARLTVDARDANGRFLNNLTMQANVVAPDGSVQNLLLSQVAPGRYEASFLPTVEGAYFIRVSGTSSDFDNEETTIGQTSGWVLGYSPEYQQFRSNPELLASLAEMSGGKDVSADVTAVFNHDLPADNVSRPIWPWLMTLAVILLPLDIALRRLVITRRDLQRARAAILGRWQKQSAAPATRSEQMARLFQAKQRSTPTRSQPPTTSQSSRILRRDADHPEPTISQPAATSDEKRPSSPPKSPKPTRPATPPQSGTLAARLLAKKQNQQKSDDS